MSAGDKLAPEQMEKARQVWNRMAQACLAGVAELAEIGVHKQWANRPLEWFGYIDVLVSATEWQNFFGLRTHSDAQPEIQELAEAMYVVYSESVPTPLKPGEWHLPYCLPEEIEQYGGLTDPTGMLRKLSVARCARLTIQPFDGNASIDAEIARYNKLVGSTPIHASPSEHQATPDTTHWQVEMGATWTEFDNPHLHGNFSGWIQNRKLIPGEDKAPFERPL